MDGKPTTFKCDMPPHKQHEDSKVAVNHFQFLFNNPLLLQNLLSWEKLIPLDQLEIDWVLHPDRPVVQTVSLIRLQRSYLAARFHVRITSESRVLAMPSNLVFPYNSLNSVDLNNLSDSDVIPQVVEEFFTVSEDRYMLLLHHSESTWEMIGCLSTMPFIIKAQKPVVELSSENEEAVSLSPLRHPSTSSTTMYLPVWTNPDGLQSVPNMVDPLDITDYGAHHRTITVALPGELSIFDFEMLKMTASMITTRNEPPFQCSICNITAWSKKSLLRHLNVHDPRKSLKCPISSCSFVTHKKCQLDHHVFSFHTVGKIDRSCPTQTKVETKKFVAHDPRKSLKCPVSSCSFVTHKKCHLDRHVLSFHTVRKIDRSCPTQTKVETKKFVVPSTYERVVKNCSSINKIFLCSICNFKANSYLDLFKHERLEHSYPS